MASDHDKRERAPPAAGTPHHGEASFGKWLKQAWPTVLMLVLIFALALFLRGYMGFEAATTEHGDFLLSGGSDSYYHKRAIDYAATTGEHLTEDTMLNYPVETRNPRPPLFDWSVVVIGKVLSPLFSETPATDVAPAYSSEQVAIWYVLLVSTAVWGALTIFPLYYLTKEVFGYRVGLGAAFLLAISAGHIERSVLSNADHDSFNLFFIVLAFYFFLKALSQTRAATWVKDWSDLKQVRAGLSRYFVVNQRATLYAGLAALTIAAVGLGWKGYAYTIVIIIVYFGIQMLISRWRSEDTTHVFFTSMIAVGGALLLIFPYYWTNNLFNNWFDVPLYLFGTALIFGAIFMVTRDLPWILVLPGSILFAGVMFLLVFLYDSALAISVVSGAGYFVRSKQYETIAEAQAPDFSRLALAFGAITFYLSLVGVAWAAWRIRNERKADFLFLVVWAAAAIFMAVSAARFMTNASPAFAITAAWVLGMLLAWVDFGSIRSDFAAFGGAGIKNTFKGLWRAIHFRHYFGVIVVAFLILLPNLWLAVDAGTPFENKREVDLILYRINPCHLFEGIGWDCPPDYDETNGSVYYTGAFGYSLPLPTNYYPAGYRWLSQQDRELPAEERPGFLSWWDYGFEAIQQGQHPSVADNFLGGHQLAGSFLMAQGEEEGLALLSARLLEGDHRGNDLNLRPVVRDILTDHGIDPDRIETILDRPADVVAEVRDNPQTYGPRDIVVQPSNAKYAVMRVAITDSGDLEHVNDLYLALQQATGKSIRYFAVDVRLFPFSAQSTGIFYAPAKLSDHRIDDNTNTPFDFFSVAAVSDLGERIPLDEVGLYDIIVDYEIDYHPMFWESMLYRNYIGYSDYTLGEDPDDASEVVPGISAAAQNELPMHGWDLAHWRLVYRTAYYNPYNASTIGDHPEAWQAINYFDALDRVLDPADEGIVDLSTRAALSSPGGVIMLKYYAGAVLRGNVTMADGTPFPGARVTVFDDTWVVRQDGHFGDLTRDGTLYDLVPHQDVLTDANGSYEVVLPFGNVTLVVSTGELADVDVAAQRDLAKLRLLPDEVARTNIIVTDAQSMRVAEDLDGDGVEDWLLYHDFTVETASITGRIFLDGDADGSYQAATDTLADNSTTITFSGELQEVTTTLDDDGTYEVSDLLPGTYQTRIHSAGHLYIDDQADIEVKVGTDTTYDYPIPVLGLSGTAVDLTGAGIAGATVTVTDDQTGDVYTTNTSTDGTFSLAGLPDSDYVALAISGPLASTDLRFSGERLVEHTWDPILVETGRFSGVVRDTSGDAVPYASLLVTSQTNSTLDRIVKADADGGYSMLMPAGSYSIYATHIDAGAQVILATISSNGTDQTLGLAFTRAAVVSGTMLQNNLTLRSASVTFSGAAALSVTSDRSGNYQILLPDGAYQVFAVDSTDVLVTEVTISGDTALDLTFSSGTRWSGALWDRSLNVGVTDATVTFTDADGLKVTTTAGINGFWEIHLPAGNYTFTATKPGYPPLTAGPAQLAEGQPNPWSALDLNVSAPSVTGLVSGDGDPLAGAILTFEPVFSGGTTDTRPVVNVTTGSSGRYSIDLIPGGYTVSTSVDAIPGDDRTAYVTREAAMELPVGISSMTMDLTMDLRTRVAVDLTVDGESVNGTMEVTGPEEVRAIISTVDPEPLYLLPGTYEVRAVAPGRQNFTLLTVGATAANVTLPLGPALSRVLNLKVADVVQSITLFGNVTNAAGVSVPVDFRAGTFSVSLAEGDYTLVVAGEASQSVDGVARRYAYSLDDAFTVDDLTRYDFAMDRVLANATLTLNLTPGDVIVAIDLRAIDEQAISTVVDAVSGSVAIPATAGTYQLWVNGTNLGNVSTVEHGDQATTIAVDLGALTNLNGNVLLRDGPTTPAANWTLKAPTGTSITIALGSTGSFAITLPQGNYSFTLSIEAPGPGGNDTYQNSSYLVLDSLDQAEQIYLEIADRFAVAASVPDAANQSLEQGDNLTVQVTISNTGNVVDTYKVGGNPGSWQFYSDPLNLSLEPGVSGVIAFTINVSTSAMVTDQLRITVQSESDSAAREVVEPDMPVTPTYGLTASLSGTGTAGATRLSFDIVLRNEGNGADVADFEVLNTAALADRGWALTINSTAGEVAGNQVTNLSVAAGSNTALINVILVATRPVPDVDASLEVSVRSESDPTAVGTASFELPQADLRVDGGNLTAVGIDVTMTDAEPSRAPIIWLGVVSLLMLGVAYLIFRQNLRRIPGLRWIP